MNILTFDIEEWFINKEYNGNDTNKYAKYDRLLNHILDKLDSRDIKATFFCLGRIASDFPHVVKLISARGHEIGCHSNSHRWVNKMTPEEFRADTHAAVAALEDVAAQKIVSFRAPAFSIGSSNKWALEILKENGIENDASIFPAPRDFGGFPEFGSHRPCRIEYNGVQLNEFPIPLLRLPIVGKEIAFSGGGYFRLMPLSIVRQKISSSDYAMCYFHIADLLTEKTTFMSRQEFETYFKENGPFHRRLLRYIKSNIGRGKALIGLDTLLDEFQFSSIQQYLANNTLTKTIKL